MPQDTLPGTRSRLNRRFEDMKRERSSYENRWRALAEYLLPMRSRFSRSDENRGDRSNNRILNGTPTKALDFMTSSLLQGTANPASRWFNHRARRRSLNVVPAVRAWTETFRDAILEVFDEADLYTALEEVYKDEIAFATGTMLTLEDPSKVIKAQTFPIGSYVLAQDGDGNVDTFGREFMLSARQMREQFPEDRLSDHVKRLLDSGNKEERVQVRHLIEPRRDAREDFGAAGLPWRDVYWEVGDGSPGTAGDPSQTGMVGLGFAGEETLTLRESGFHERPFMAGRWYRSAQDVYGTSCPGMVTLGDNKTLQDMQRDFLNGLKKMVDPPLNATPSLRNSTISLVSGAVTYGDGMTQGPAVSPIHEVRLPLNELRQAILDTEQAIEEGFFKSVLLAFLGDKRLQRATATEVDAQLEEKLSILGTVQQRLEADVLEPLVDRVGAILIRRSEPFWAAGQEGPLPPPPPELSGEDVIPEYESQVTRSQRLSSLAPIRAFSSAVAEAATFNPEAIDKINVDALLDEVGSITGVPVSIIRETEEAQALRDARRKAAEAAAAAEMAPKMGRAAKDLSQAKVGSGNALEALDASLGS